MKRIFRDAFRRRKPRPVPQDFISEAVYHAEMAVWHADATVRWASRAVLFACGAVVIAVLGEVL